MIIVVPDDAPGIVTVSTLEHKLRELGELHVFDSLAITESLLLERLAGADVALTVAGSNFTEAVLRECPQLRHIAVFGIGVDNVDMDACRSRGITATNTPAYSASIVAEKAIALALAWPTKSLNWIEPLGVESGPRKPSVNCMVRPWG